MFAKKLFYVSASLFLLAAAYHLGATNAGAQAPGNSVVASPQNNVVFTANGDLYYMDPYSFPSGRWQLMGNVFTGGTPTTTRTQSFGALKAKYR